MSDEPRKLKRRTREHIIADLGVNFVERQILLAGFTMERKIHDYGLDTHMTTHDANGEIENETVWFQITATDHANYSPDNTAIVVRVDSANLRYWLLELMPVIVVVYDATTDRGYWIEVQEYAQAKDLDSDEIGETVTLRIPVANAFTVEAVRVIRERKEQARQHYWNARYQNPE